MYVLCETMRIQFRLFEICFWRVINLKDFMLRLCELWKLHELFLCHFTDFFFYQHYECIWFFLMPKQVPYSSRLHQIWYTTKRLYCKGSSAGCTEWFMGLESIIKSVQSRYKLSVCRLSCFYKYLSLFLCLLFLLLLTRNTLLRCIL